MSLTCGIVGLPNVGKSTLFNALTQTAKAEAQNYPFCTIEPNIGRVCVNDERLEKDEDYINKMVLEIGVPLLKYANEMHIGKRVPQSLGVKWPYLGAFDPNAKGGISSKDTKNQKYFARINREEKKIRRTSTK